MLRMAGLIKPARFAKRIPGVRPGKWTSWEDTFMWHVWRGRNHPETFLPDFSQGEDGE